MGPTIAVVSDLHVGADTRAVDMNPYADKSRSTDANYVDKFIAFVVANKLSADYLLIPGDITNKAAPDEFQLASAQLRRISDALRVPADHIVFVPGNHDVDWSVMKAGGDANSKFRFSQRYAPLLQHDCIFAEIMNRAGADKLTQDPYFCAWTLPGLLIVGLNSARHDGPDETVHHGLVLPETVAKLDDTLTKMYPRDHRLRIFIAHHHPVIYSDPIAGEPDFSAMTNAPALLEVLAKHHFDLLVHGHKHKPNFQIHQVRSHYQLGILCAGSFSYKLDYRWSGVVSNQFHRVVIHDRDPNSASIRGVVESYAYLSAHGWVKSIAASTGIEHQIYFGGFETKKSLRERLRSILKHRFQHSDYIRWSSCVEDDNDLAYVSSHLVTEILSELEVELRFKIFAPDVGEFLLLAEK